MQLWMIPVSMHEMGCPTLNGLIFRAAHRSFDVGDRETKEGKIKIIDRFRIMVCATNDKVANEHVGR